MANPVWSQFQHLGVVVDIPPEQVPEDRWTDAINFKFQNRASERIGGYNQFAGTPSVAPIFALNLIRGPNSYWIYCSTTAVWVTDGTAHWNITPAGLALCAAGDWTGTILNGIPVLNNTTSPPFSWNGNTANICTTIPGWPVGALCGAIRAFKYHLFAIAPVEGGITFGSSIWWSDAADPGTLPSAWTPTPANDAGDLVLGDTIGNCIDALALRDALMVYKSQSVYVINYVAGQYVYTARKLFLTAGVQARNCIAEISGEHWVWTGIDLIRHDGQQFRSTLQDKVKEKVAQSIDPSKIQLIHVMPRLLNTQCWLMIPTQGQTWCDQAVIVNTDTEDCGLRLLPTVAFVARGLINKGVVGISWASDTNPWNTDITAWNQQNFDPTSDSALMCDAGDVKLWQVDGTDSENGAPVSAFVERQSLPLQNPLLRNIVLRVVPRIEGEVGEVIYIRVGGQPNFGTPVTWSPSEPFVIGTTVACNFQTEGRLISVRFQGSTMRTWKIHSYRIESVEQGLY